MKLQINNYSEKNKSTCAGDSRCHNGRKTEEIKVYMFCKLLWQLFSFPSHCTSSGIPSRELSEHSSDGSWGWKNKKKYVLLYKLNFIFSPRLYFVNILEDIGIYDSNTLRVRCGL